MEKPDYARRFNVAITKAFAASDVRVRLAYFDLAGFYHRKLKDRMGMHPSAELLRSAAKEACHKKQCWCK